MSDRTAALVDTFIRVDDVTMHLDDGTTEDVDRCVLIVPLLSGVAAELIVERARSVFGGDRVLVTFEGIDAPRAALAIDEAPFTAKIAGYRAARSGYPLAEDVVLILLRNPRACVGIEMENLRLRRNMEAARRGYEERLRRENSGAE